MDRENQQKFGSFVKKLMNADDGVKLGTMCNFYREGGCKECPERKTCPKSLAATQYDIELSSLGLVTRKIPFEEAPEWYQSVCQARIPQVKEYALKHEVFRVYAVYWKVGETIFSNLYTPDLLDSAQRCAKANETYAALYDFKKVKPSAT